MQMLQSCAVLLSLLGDLVIYRLVCNDSAVMSVNNQNSSMN